MAELDDALLNEYLDGTLNEAARQEVERQLAQSPEAQARLAELQSLFAAFEDVTEVPLPNDLSTSVLAAIRSDETPQSTSWGLRLLPILQLVVVVILLGIFWTALLEWLQYGRANLSEFIPTVPLPALMPTEAVQDWLTAVWLEASNFSFQIELAAGQWLLLLSIALVFWLIGNRLLFTNLNLNGGSHG